MKAPRRAVAEALAGAFLSTGPWTTCALARRGRHALGIQLRWPIVVARRVRERFPDPPRDAFSELATFIAADRDVVRACAPGGSLAIPAARALRFGEVVVAMAPRWTLPRLDTTGDVARWLGLSLNDLAWLADLSGHARRPRDARLGHYTARWLPKRSGGARLVEAPKRSLKEVQRRILWEILEHIPPHEAAHGFRRGRSPVTHAAAHAGRRVVLRIDLEEFFVSIPVARVTAMFRGAGFPRTVARVLASLCTTFSATPAPVLSPDANGLEVAARWRSLRRYAARHLPQGAPTSPAIANLCSFALDQRLAAAAAKVGAVYTRYADDLVFSSDQRLDRFAPLVSTIAHAEGFMVNHRKTRLMRAAVRQEVTGLVVNRRPNVARREVERLEAILFNCVRSGPQTQNREAHPDFRAHLLGKVAWVASVSPERAARLRELLERIVWT